MNDHSSSLTVEDLLAPAVCVPPPIHPHMPLYLRCRAQLHEWGTLKDTYAASVIRNGLQLDWVGGFDPDRPTDDFRPRSSHAEVTDPELVKHVLDAVQQGCMERVERKDIKCCASMFAVDKASDEAHPEGGRRPITNLKNVNQFVQTTYFRLVTLWGILPFLRPGQYACKIDLKSAYFHMGIHPRDRPYLGVYVDGEFYRWCVFGIFLEKFQKLRTYRRSGVHIYRPTFPGHEPTPPGRKPRALPNLTDELYADKWRTKFKPLIGYRIGT